MSLAASNSSSWNSRQRRTWLGLFAITLVATFISLFLGQSAWDESLRTTFLELRAWRIAVAFGLGGCLAMAGVVIQAIFQNPLAGPSIIGTNAGAALGGQLMMFVFHLGLIPGLAAAIAPELLVPFGAFIGAWGALTILLVLVGRRADSLVALLVGFLLSSIFASVGAFVLARSQETWNLGRAMLSFSMGSIAGAGPRQAGLVLFALLVSSLGAFSWRRHLDMMLTGDDEAMAMGMDVASVRRWGIIWASVACAAAVAVGGNIAFVGLITPHLLRPLVGNSARALLPASAVAGGAFVILCDLVARQSASHGETPLGVITGLIGAPVFLYLLIRMNRAEGRHG